MGVHVQIKNRHYGLIVIVLVLVSAAVQAAEPALWLRYPAISPDGASVVFSHRGDLWRVPVEGGLATQLTVHAAHDTRPVWSPDGSTIAFASDRYGNYDVFVMPAEGGKATRLTYHSASDEPTSFTPDGASVLFSSGRLDSASCVQYPRRGAQPELYRVSLAGGMPEQVLSTPAMYAVWNRRRFAARLLGREGSRDRFPQARRLLVCPRRVALRSSFGSAPAPHRLRP